MPSYNLIFSSCDKRDYLKDYSTFAFLHGVEFLLISQTSKFLLNSADLLSCLHLQSICSGIYDVQK